MKILALVILLCDSLVWANGCPDLRGQWQCAIYTGVGIDLNSTPKDLEGSEVSADETAIFSQKTLTDGTVAYDMAGVTIRAREGQALINKTPTGDVSALCLQGELHVSFKDEIDTPMTGIYRRQRSEMRSFQRPEKPGPFDDNTLYICHLSAGS